MDGDAKLRSHEKPTGPSSETEKSIGWRRYVQFDYALRNLPRKMSQRAPGVTSPRSNLGPLGFESGTDGCFFKTIFY